jgi:hypothetical protein
MREKGYGKNNPKLQAPSSETEHGIRFKEGANADFELW